MWKHPSKSFPERLLLEETTCFIHSEDVILVNATGCDGGLEKLKPIINNS
jgi:hypothetical protein